MLRNPTTYVHNFHGRPIHSIRIRCQAWISLKDCMEILSPNCVWIRLVSNVAKEDLTEGPLPDHRRFVTSSLIRHEALITLASSIPGATARAFSDWVSQEFSPENDNLDSDQMSEMLEAIDDIAANSWDAKEARKEVCKEIYRISGVGCRCDIKVKFFSEIMDFLYSVKENAGRTLQGQTGADSQKEGAA